MFPSPSRFVAVLPWLILGLLAILLLRALFSSPRLPLAPISLALPTARVETATPTAAAPAAVPRSPSPSPSPTPVPSISTIALGFTPDALDLALAHDTPYTVLGGIVWEHGEAICAIAVPYEDAAGRVQQTPAWIRCADIHAPPPHPASASHTALSSPPVPADLIPIPSPLAPLVAPPTPDAEGGK
ncbi:MAG: hypothetical protein EI684_03485 [Candidatus Viridilinea halotolerans]|uniref:Uncharacterized protein n=1 Tax=Candidatus Viridilinea halotolerans TaxID=2491704 RepID=A0A426U7M4_9CHLR|nr:MAG: hypothetical protein EI684_03485 [Candidatus Viridilinea halotolerans]